MAHNKPACPSVFVQMGRSGQGMRNSVNIKIAICPGRTVFGIDVYQAEK